MSLVPYSLTPHFGLFSTLCKCTSEITQDSGKCDLIYCFTVMHLLAKLKYELEWFFFYPVDG